MNFAIEDEYTDLSGETLFPNLELGDDWVQQLEGDPDFQFGTLTEGGVEAWVHARDFQLDVDSYVLDLEQNDSYRFEITVEDPSDLSSNRGIMVFQEDGRSVDLVMNSHGLDEFDGNVLRSDVFTAEAGGRYFIFTKVRNASDQDDPVPYQLDLVRTEDAAGWSIVWTPDGSGAVARLDPGENSGEPRNFTLVFDAPNATVTESFAQSTINGRVTSLYSVQQTGDTVTFEVVNFRGVPEIAFHGGQGEGHLRLIEGAVSLYPSAQVVEVGDGYVLPSVYEGTDDPDNFVGSAGEDTLHGDMGADTIRGDNGDDRVFGGGDDDVLAGNDGQDTMRGEDGNDRMYGGDDDDVLAGNNGNDSLDGGNGDDRLFGGNDNDTLKGGDGFDDMRGGNDADTLYGNAGNDTLRGENGDDRMFGGADDDLMAGNDGGDTMRGGEGNDRMFGGNDDDVLAGNDGNDNLDGGNGDDRLFGGEGDDTLIGEAGQDQMTGNNGADVFVFGEVSDSPHGATRDTIMDFEAGVDRIDLTGFGGLNFVASYSGAGNEVRYNDSIGRLYIDIDGGASDFSVDVGSGAGLTEDDLIL